MEEGYIAVELGDLSLWFNKKGDKDPDLKVEVEITKGYEAFKWKLSNDTKYSTENFNPVFQDSGADTELFNYIYGFENLFIKSGFIDLNNEVFSTLINTFVVIRIVGPNENAAAAAAPAAKKGAPTPAAAPAFETLVEIKIPFYSLGFTTTGGIIEVDVPFSEYSQFSFPVPVCAPHVDMNQSQFTFKIIADTCVGEFLLGSRILSWASASFTNFPHTWTLHAPDAVDPKAKVPPTAAELRTKYLENISKHIQNQSKIASYTLSIGGTNGTEGDSTINQLHQLFPEVSLANGTIQFNEEAAKEIPVEDDIRIRTDLWKISWEESSKIFLHRSQTRQLISLILTEPDHVYLPLTIKKTPTQEGLAAEGGELFATAVIDISSIIRPGQKNVFISANLQGEGMDTESGNAAPFFQVQFASEYIPLVQPPPLQNFQQPIKTKDRPNDKIVDSGLQVSSKSTNRDILQELRDEISNTIERIAQEYVSLYPQALASEPSPSNNNNNDTMSRTASDAISVNSQANNIINPQNHELEERKEKFVSYLLNNGIFLELQENLRIKVQLLIKDRYGARGRALGKSEVLKKLDENKAMVSIQEPDGNVTIPADKEQKEAQNLLQNILAELYSFLMKECTLVLNSLFKTTIIQKDLNTIENPAMINDEQENDLQIFHRLLRQGNDALADNKYPLADLIFMERLQLIDHCVSLGSNPKIVHEAYSQFAEYLLKRSTMVIYSNKNEIENYNSLLRKAREALTVAYNTIPEEFETTLLYALVLIQLKQLELAEDILLQILSNQLKNVKNSELEMETWNEFSGYETDSLYPVHPKFYAILACLLYIRGKPIECRKALLLANRSYVEGGYGKTPVTAHGKPRRTLVLILSETALYLYQYGLYSVADTALLLAKDSEASCTEKAQARDKPSITPPFITVLLKRAEAEAAWTTDSKVTDLDAVDCAMQAYLVADNPKDKVLAKLAEAKAYYHLKSQPDDLLNAYLTAIQEAMNNIPLERMKNENIIPLETFVTIGKYLVYSGLYVENINILLYGCSIYNSAALCYLLGLSYLRLERLDEAEDVFMEGNVLDNRHMDIWAYLCLVCILKGYHRLPEAERCLFQTLRLGQNDPTILRELATSFMSVDKLQIAEDLIRRTITIEIANNSHHKPNATTRKLLADILVGQNMAAKAIEEYKLLLIDDHLDWESKLMIAEKCSNLLISLGREEEIQSLKNIMENIKTADGQ